MIEGNNSYTYHFDAIGITMALTDQSQNIVNQYAYSPYGRDLGKAETRPQPFTCVGQHGVMAEQNDHYYMRARYYDADIGRFISEDPIRFEGGINLYAYVGGNPVNWVDPLGLINWGKVGLGAIEATAGGLGITLAATSEVGSLGTATIVAGTIAAFSVPALSHGVSEIIAGFLESNSPIPSASGPSVATLAVTRDLKKAQQVDLISGSIMLGSNIGSWVAKHLVL